MVNIKLCKKLHKTFKSQVSTNFYQKRLNKVRFINEFSCIQKSLNNQIRELKLKHILNLITNKVFYLNLVN